MNEEVLDLVDQNDQVIAQMPRSQVYGNKQYNFRAVDAFLINDQGKLWIPRRTKNKKMFPLCLDSSMGGHVSAGETYDQAFARELKEELGLDAMQIQYENIGKITPHEHQSFGYLNVYLIRTNEVPDFNLEDFCEFFWLTPAECIERLSSGKDKGKDNLIIILRQLFLS